MAQIPGIENFSGQSEQLPDVSRPIPPASAFGGQIGQATENVGSELGQLAEKARQSSIRDLATQAEFGSLKGMIGTVTDFSQKRGNIDPKDYDSAIKNLNDTYENTANNLPSREASQQYRNNALRTLRLSENAIHEHFNSETKKAEGVNQQNLINGKIVATTQLVTADTSKDWKSVSGTVEDGIDDLRQTVFNQARTNGFDAKSAAEQARNAAGVAADSVLTALSKQNDPDKLKAGIDQLGKYLDKPTEEAHLEKWQVKDSVQHDDRITASIVNTADRVGGLLDRTAPPTRASVGEKLNDLYDKLMTDAGDSKDAQDKAQARFIKIQDAVDKEVTRREGFFDKEGAQSYNKLIGKGAGRGKYGGQGLPPDKDDEWQDLQNYHPEYALKLRQMVDNEDRRADSAIARNHAKVSESNMTKLAVALSDMDQSKLNALDNKGLAAMMLKTTDYPGGFKSSAFTTAGPALLKKYQTLQKEGSLAWTVKAAEDAVKPLFLQYSVPGSGGVAALHKEKLYGAMLEDINEAVAAGYLKKNDPVALRKFVNAKLAAVPSGSAWTRNKRQVEIDAEERAERADDAAREAAFGGGDSQLPLTPLPRGK